MKISHLIYCITFVVINCEIYGFILFFYLNSDFWYGVVWSYHVIFEKY